MEQPADTYWWEAGIDYGTSTIKVCIAVVKNGVRVGAPQHVAFRTGPAPCEVPSMVAYHNGQLHWGTDLQKQMGKGIPFEKVIRCPKLGIYSKNGDDFDVQHMRNLLEREGKSYANLIGDHLSEVIKRTRHWLASDSTYALVQDKALLNSFPIRARIGVPAAWTAEDCAHMTEAALEAGVEICEIVPEPVAAWASCIELLLRTDMLGGKLKDGDVFAVLDAGAATLDPVLIQLIGDFGKDAKFEILAAPAGSVGSSEQVNVRIREDIVRSLQSTGGIDAKAEELGMCTEELMCRLLLQADQEKLNLEDDSKYNESFSINVGSRKGGPSFHYSIQEKVITHAIDEVIRQAIIVTHSMIEQSPKPVKALLLTGGFTGSQRFKGQMKDHFEKENLEVIAMHGPQGPMGARLLVSQGAVSEYYDSIQGSKFLLKNNYYILLEERYDPDRHPDCLKKINKNGKKPKRRYRNPDKVGRRHSFHLDPNLSDEEMEERLKEEDDVNPEIVPNRLHKVLSKDQVSEDLNPVEYTVFLPLIDDPRISASIVYSATDYVDGECAMHDDHILNIDEALKPDIKPMRTVSATLDPHELAQHGGFKIFQDGDGEYRFEVHAFVRFAYKTEATMSVRFELMPMKVNEDGETVVDDARPLAVPVDCEIWRNTHSHLWNQGD